MAIEIEKDIPLPAARRGRKFKYPWNEMEVGDSFFVAGQDTMGSAAKAAYNMNRKGRGHFICHVENGGVRIWRIE